MGTSRCFSRPRCCSCKNFSGIQTASYVSDFTAAKNRSFPFYVDSCHHHGYVWLDSLQMWPLLLNRLLSPAHKSSTEWEPKHGCNLRTDCSGWQGNTAKKEKPWIQSKILQLTCHWYEVPINISAECSCSNWKVYHSQGSKLTSESLAFWGTRLYFWLQSWTSGLKVSVASTYILIAHWHGAMVNLEPWLKEQLFFALLDEQLLLLKPLTDVFCQLDQGQ